MPPERRRQPRVHVVLSADVKVERELSMGETEDLSVSGVRVLCDELLERGATVEVTLAVPRDAEDEDDDPFECTATVQWARTKPDGRCVAGLKFGPLTAAQKRDLVRLLQSATAPA